MNKRMKKQLVAILLSAAMIVLLLPMTGFGTVVTAAEEQDKTITGLGTSSIKAPKDPEDENADWTGSYVWFGKYGGTPLKFRVLAPQTNLYGSNTMLLDCDNALYKFAFDKDNVANSGANSPTQWLYSDLRANLNENGFLDRANGLSECEKAAIAYSRITSHPLVSGTGINNVSYSTKTVHGNFVGIGGDKIFVLDAEDVSNRLYGYQVSDDARAVRVKETLKGEHAWWWVRSGCTGSFSDYVGMVNSQGDLTQDVPNEKNDVSPALNVSQSSVLFTSLVSGTAGQDGAEYKLTLRDTKLTIGFTGGQTVYYANKKVYIPYTISGDYANTAERVSVLVLDKDFKLGNTNNANVIYYGKLPTTETFSKSGTAVFTLPSGLDINEWGNSYYVYILAEDLNGMRESDYASTPKQVAKPAVDKTIISAKAKSDSIVKGTTQTFNVITTSDVLELILYSEDGKTKVNSWGYSGNCVLKDGVRKWTVSQTINTPGDRKLVFKGAAKKNLPVTNAVNVSFKVKDTAVISASVRFETLKQGYSQEFTVQTTSDAKYLMLYGEGGNLVKTWTATSSNSTVSGGVRTWTVYQNINTAGNRKLTIKAGTTTTPTDEKVTVSFKVVDVWVEYAWIESETIGKGGIQKFSVGTSSNAEYLMLYAEDGSLVQTWKASSSNSTSTGSTRHWTVERAINSLGYRQLVLKAGKTKTPGELTQTVNFSVAEKRVIDARVVNNSIAKGQTQTFDVWTTADVKYLMLYAEDGNLVKTWAANSSNSTETAAKTRIWKVQLAINTPGNRTLTFKGGTTNKTPVTNEKTVSFSVANTAITSVTAQYDVIAKGGNQVFIVKTPLETTKVVEYAEDGKTLVKTWEASSADCTVSDGVRTWTLTQKINTAGNRNLIFKGGNKNFINPSGKTASFKVLSAVPVTADYFPHLRFRNWISENVDTNHDGKLSESELGVKVININDLGVRNLKGIEFFTSLEEFYCVDCDIESLDLSRNILLEYLDCTTNDFTEIDLSANRNLREVHLDCTHLTSLDMSDHPLLYWLDCSNCEITSLNVSNCPALDYLDCRLNQIEKLDLKDNTKLETLWATDNLLTTLDLSNNPALREVRVDSGVTVRGIDSKYIIRG